MKFTGDKEATDRYRVVVLLGGETEDAARYLYWTDDKDWHSF